MRFIILRVLAIGIVFTAACNPYWDEYYNGYPETINENVWSAMQADQSISQFVEVLKEYELDTLFETNISYTIFAPTNEASEAFMGSIDTTLLRYHICELFINSSNITSKRKVQTLTKKFALFDRPGNLISIDGVEVASESPLYLNGRYFIMNEVIEPKPNLYEFYKATNPILSTYIDSKDSVVLDKEQSVPIGYDENDNTIYDSVKNVINIFELTYFEVKQEFREASATIVFPLQEDYYEALDNMAEDLGSGYTDHNDIPLDWQNDILLPYLIDKGIFANMLEPEVFIPESPTKELKLVNILGDSVVIDYTPADKNLCSNGYAYNYNSFQVPTSLYSGENILEGESLTYQTGNDKFVWKEGVNVQSSSTFAPKNDFVGSASNDSILKVLFPNGYTGEFELEFKSPRLFPRRYVLEIRTHMDYGGVYEIYINEVLAKTFDYREFIIFGGFIESVEPDVYYLPNGRYNSFDMYVDNIVEYGEATIRIKYTGPSTIPNNGLIIDYLEFRAAAN